MENIVKEFLEKKNIAVAGSFKSKEKVAYRILLELIKKGYNVFPINPNLNEIEGIKCYGLVNDIPVTVDAIDIVTPPEVTEKIVEDCKIKGIKYCILRYFNVCGANDDGTVGDSKRPSSLLVQNAVRGALGIEKFYLTCPEVDTPDKTPIRDYIDVVDLNEAHLKALEYLVSSGKSETINLGTGTGYSVLEVIDQVKKLTGINIPIEKANTRLESFESTSHIVKNSLNCTNNIWRYTQRCQQPN